MVSRATRMIWLTWGYGTLRVCDRDQYWIDGLIKAVARHEASRDCGSVDGGQQQSFKGGDVGIVEAGKLLTYTNRGAGSVLWMPLCDRHKGHDVQASLEEGEINMVYRSESVDTVIEKLVHAYRVQEKQAGKCIWYH